jgi:hypothetical protein
MPIKLDAVHLGARWIVERVQEKLGEADPEDIRGWPSFLPRVQRSNADYEFVGDWKLSFII